MVRFHVPARLQAVPGDMFEEVHADTLAFAGACMIRRLVGMAHVADMDSIEDPDLRCAACLMQRYLKCEAKRIKDEGDSKSTWASRHPARL